MKSRDIGFTILGAFAAMLLFFSMRVFLWNAGDTRAPAVAGQQVPQTYFQVDFSKRYNIGISGTYERSARSYENAKILGYTGPKRSEDVGGMSSKYAYFDDWLVIELSDGRRAFFASRSVSYLEEAKPN